MQSEEFAMIWNPERQTIYRKSLRFDHMGSVRTFPTHDLAHLLVGACGDLEWLPVGTADEKRIAEYNAVFLENLLDKTFYNVVNKVEHPILWSSLRYLRWFVFKHFTPFPIPAEEAYRRFCWRIDASAAVRLSPYFFP